MTVQARADGTPRELLPPLRLYRDYRYSIELMERWIRRRYDGRPLRIMEAGCGNKWPLDLEGMLYTLTAVDLDASALELRSGRLRDVDRMIVGDLRRDDLAPAGHFDVVYNSFVLEHVRGAEQVLHNFLKWLAPGGLLILRIPDRDSVYGFCTRATPFWFHVLYKKYVQGIRNAGRPGYDPYPTFHDAVVSRRGIHRFCRMHGCRIRDEAGNANYLPQRPLQAVLAHALVRSVSLLSLGRLDWRHNNLTFIIEKLATLPTARDSQVT